MDRSNLGRMVLVALVIATLGACGSDGRDGANGAKGRDGTNGANGSAGPSGSNGANGLSAVVNVSPEPAGPNCASGGNRIDYGQDTNGNAVLDASEITGTQYTCNGSSPITYKIGGTVSGLAGTLVLQNNSNGYLVLSSAGTFTFSTPVNVGDAYAVTVLTQPRGQTCSVTNGSGSAVANVTSVQVNCTATGMTAVSLTPAPGSSNVDRTAAPSMVFSAALDPTTVTPANVILRSPAGDEPLTLHVSGTQLTATPTRQLLPATTYEMRALTGLRGNAGEQLFVDVSSTFTTRDGQWKTPTLLETLPGTAGTPRIAMDANGNALAVWRQSAGGRDDVWASRYIAGVGWGTATLIETDDTARVPFSPKVAMDASGNAIAVWALSDGVTDKVWANRYTVGGGWGMARRIENSVGNVTSGPDVAVDAEGNAVVVWSAPDAGVTSIWANRYTPAGGWSTATAIESSANSAEAPKVAMAPGGNAVAVWQELDAGRTSIVAIHYTPGTGWGTPTFIEADDAVARDAEVAMDANGNAVAVWRQFSGTNSIWANRYSPGSGWGTPALIETDDTGNANGPQIAMDPNGNALAVWMQSDGIRVNIWANRYTPAGGWGTATLIETDNNGSADTPRIAINAAGNAWAVWQQFDGVTHRTWTNRYFIGSGWGTAVRVPGSGTLGNFMPPHIAVDANSNALAVWTQQEPSIPVDIMASRFE